MLDKFDAANVGYFVVSDSHKFQFLQTLDSGDVAKSGICQAARVIEIEMSELLHLLEHGHGVVVDEGLTLAAHQVEDLQILAVPGNFVDKIFINGYVERQIDLDEVSNLPEPAEAGFVVVDHVTVVSSVAKDPGTNNVKLFLPQLPNGTQFYKQITE